jgi:hypothetical protein
MEKRNFLPELGSMASPYFEREGLQRKKTGYRAEGVFYQTIDTDDIFYTYLMIEKYYLSGAPSDLLNE